MGPEQAQEAHQSRLIPPHLSSVAPLLQPSLSASSAVRPAALSHQQAFLSRNATGFGQDDTAGLDAFDYHLLEKSMLLEATACLQTIAPSKCNHPRGPSIPTPGNRPAPAQSVEPAILTPAVPAAQWRPAVLKGRSPPRPPQDSTPPSKLCRRCGGCGTASRPACSDCACLPAVLDKQRLCTPVVGPLTSESTALTLLKLRRRGAALLIRHNIQMNSSNAAFKLTLVLAGPRPAAESAHNKNLQSRFSSSQGRSSEGIEEKLMERSIKLSVRLRLPGCPRI